MAAPGWRTADPLTRRLRQDYAHIDFYQLVWLLLLERRRQANAPAKAMTTVTVKELDASVRFRSNAEGAFPGREVCAVQDREVVVQGETHPAPPDVVMNNYCLAGAQGPLPDTYIEWIRDQERDGNGDTNAFLDIFNHRFNALRYRLKARHRPSLEGTNPEQGRIAGYLAAMMGLFTPGLAEQLPLPRRALLGLAGLLTNSRRSPPVLQAVLRTYLQVPVRLEPLQGNWHAIEKSDLMALGKANCRLGQDSIAGAKTWDEHADVTIVVGPMDYSRFIQLLPEKNPHAHSAFATLLRYLLDRRHNCLVRFLVQDDPTPEPQHPERHLTAAPDARRVGLYLGHTAWCSGNKSDKAKLRRVDVRIPAFPLPRAA